MGTIDGIRESMSGRISKEELRRHYEMTVKASSQLTDSDDTFKGFIAGFRMYERMATTFGKNLHEQESRLIVPMGQESVQG